MGRVTIFALTECPHCKRTKAALTARNIPYTEISLTTHPAKRTDMLALADRLTVPQVFFNDKHIGGADDTLELLERWDKENKFPTPLERYQKEVEAVPGPKDPRLEVPTTPPVKEVPPPPRNERESFLQLPNGTKTVSALDVTKDLMSIMPKSDMKYLTTTYKNCFTGKSGVTALMEHYGIKSRTDAVQFGRTLQRKQLLHHVTKDHTFGDSDKFFRLQAYDQPFVLNSLIVWTERIDPNPMALVGRLKKLLGQIESSATNEDGLVDYVAMEADERYLDFEEQVSELQSVKMLPMDDKTKLAFGINLYNLMVKHAFVKLGIASASISRSSFFSTASYNVGGDVLALSDLENGVLRGNSVPPYMINPPFSQTDPRRKLALPKADPRIHFALNCGAKSCPPVKKFSADAVDEELRIVAQAFCEQEGNVTINADKDEVSFSMIFNWYRPDFAPNTASLPQSVVPYLRGEKKAMMQYLIDSKRPVKVKFSTYDWGTNALNSKTFQGSGKIAANETAVRAIFSGLGI